MKKIIATLALIGLLAMPALSFAAEEEEEVGGVDIPDWAPGSNITDLGDILDIIDTVGGYIFMGLLALSAIFLVVAGYYFLTAGGNPEKVNVARQMVINALIGVGVGLAARGLITVISNLVQG